MAGYRQAGFAITGSRAVEEWLGWFDDSILGNSVLDRRANAGYPVVIKGVGYWEKPSPQRRNDGLKYYSLV